MNRLDMKYYGNWDLFVQTVQLCLVDPGIVIVENLRSEDERDLLVLLANSLGTVSQHDVSAPDDANHQIHQIAPKETPVIDSDGFPILSTSLLAFPSHTDDYFESKPADLVMFNCVRQAEDGGTSLIAHLKLILERLDGDTIETLKQPNFPARFGLTPLLTESEAGLLIRYNRLETERGAQLLNYQLEPAQIQALDAFDAAIDAVQIQFKLRENDCIVINNSRILHGRTAITNGSNRLLRRVKIYLS